MRVIEAYLVHYFRDKNSVGLNSGLEAAHFKRKELNRGGESMTTWDAASLALGERQQGEYRLMIKIIT